MATYPAQPDYVAQQGALFAQQVRVEVDRLNSEYKKRLDMEVINIIADLKRDAASRIRSIVISAIAVIVAGFALLVYAQTRSLNNTYIEFQNGVMALQKEVLATANGLGEKASLVAAADKELDAATRRLENTTTEYQSRLQALAVAGKEIDAATTRLKHLADDYEARLKKSAPPAAK